MNWKKYDKFWLGTVCGVIAPMLAFVAYWLIFQPQISFPFRFIRYLMGGHLLSNVLKMCTLINLVLFWLSLNRKMDLFTRGVILAVFLYVALILYVMYYLEVEVI